MSEQPNEFNINNYVKVKLTKKGVELLRKEQEAREEELRNYRLSASLDLSLLTPKADDDGYTKFQLWDLMAIFGPHIAQVGELPIETNIIIEQPKE